MLVILLILSVVLAVSVYKYYCNYRDEREKSKQLHNDYQEEKQKADALYNKYSGISDIEEELENLKSELHAIEESIAKAQENYNADNVEYNKLLELKKTLEEDIDIFQSGLYKPHFDFGTSEDYKLAITDNYEQQKIFIKSKKAIDIDYEWGGEEKFPKDSPLIKKYSELMLKAFNNECDIIMEKTKWNNYNGMLDKIYKAPEIMDKLGDIKNICSLSINSEYWELKLEQFHLVYEYKEKKQQEKEEQAQIREEMREERLAQEEYERVQKEAEDAEQHYIKALEQARKEMASAKDNEINQYLSEIELLEQQLKEAQENKQRAISQAQLTKAGHIYVISNIGSFGENVYKIGMTRRLEPLDRVRELGDASVPFRFDVHALIYSENAPELENKLHNVFRDKSVNLVNYKKEFFNVTLEEIQKAVEENFGQIEFTKIAEAREYRESLEILKAQSLITTQK